MDNGFVLYSHGGSGNHGCEALARSTCAILHNASVGSRIDLISGSIHLLLSGFGSQQEDLRFL